MNVSRFENQGWNDTWTTRAINATVIFVNFCKKIKESKDRRMKNSAYSQTPEDSQNILEGEQTDGSYAEGTRLEQAVGRREP